MSSFVRSMVSVGLILVGAGIASAQDYPFKPVRIYAGPTGGGNDFAARAIAKGIAEPLGQPVIVENRSGALPRLTVAKAPPDGYSLVLAGSGIGVAPLLEPTLDYDAVRDFSPVTVTTWNPNILIVHPSMPAKTVKELIALAKAKPGEMNTGVTSAGSGSHLATELFKSMAGIKVQNIQYKGSQPAVLGLIVGETHMTITTTGAGMPFVGTGKVRALAVTSLKPTALAPGIPTMAASGLPGYEAIGFDGIYGPGKMPGPIVTRLNREIVRFLSTKEAREQFLTIDQEVSPSSPEELGGKMKGEIDKWSKVLRDLGMIKTR